METSKPFLRFCEGGQVSTSLSNRVLHLDFERLGGGEYFRRYSNDVEAFLSIEGQCIQDGDREHLNILLGACVAFVGVLAEALSAEDWFSPDSRKHRWRMAKRTLFRIDTGYLPNATDRRLRGRRTAYHVN